MACKSKSGSKSKGSRPMPAERKGRASKPKRK
jgi:hypothetical protein